MINNSKRDNCISIIRLIATCCIVICHMMQWANFVLAWWFNVGVQIFLCMSGYLYGFRTIENSLDFLKKNFKKILTDYYIVVTLAILALAVAHRDELSLAVIGRAYLTSSTLPGGEHLWYISYILFCYLLTPLYNQWFERTLKNVCGGGYKTFILLGCILIGNTLLLTEFTKFSAVWVNCYILGMFFGKLKFHSRRRELSCFKIIILFLCLSMNAVQIVTDYTSVPLYSILFRGHFTSLYTIFCHYAHVFLGLSLFAVMYDIISALLKKRERPLIGKICAVSDEYSYRVYLVHQWLILGPFSLMAVTPWRALNIVIILACVATFAAILGIIDRYIKWIGERVPIKNKVSKLRK